MTHWLTDCEAHWVCERSPTHSLIDWFCNWSMASVNQRIAQSGFIIFKVFYMHLPILLHHKSQFVWHTHTHLFVGTATLYLSSMLMLISSYEHAHKHLSRYVYHVACTHSLAKVRSHKAPGPHGLRGRASAGFFDVFPGSTWWACATWRRSVIIPELKKSASSTPADLRLIALTSIFCKCMKWVILGHLTSQPPLCL